MTDIVIKPRFELEECINEDMVEFHQRSAVCVLRVLTEYYKDRLRPEVYQELSTFYSMSESERAEYRSQKLKERAKKRAEKRKRKKEIDQEIRDNKVRIARIQNGRDFYPESERPKIIAQYLEKNARLENERANLPIA